MEGIFASLFNASTFLSYKASQAIDFGKSGDGKVFFLHRGCVMGMATGTPSPSRVILGGEVFANLHGLTDWPTPRFSWINAGEVAVTAIPLEKVEAHYALVGLSPDRLAHHLVSLDMGRTALYEALMPLPIADKLDYLEEHAPRLLLEVKGVFLARFLHITPEALSREISKKSL